MEMRRLALSFLLVATAAVLPGCGDRTPAPTAAATQPVAATAPPAVERQNFDLTVSIADPRFNYRLSDVYDALAREVQPKGKYESTSDFNARMAEAKKAVLFDEVKAGGLFAVRVPQSGQFHVHYDADRQVFRYRLFLYPDSGFATIESERRQLNRDSFPVDNQYFEEKHFKRIEHTDHYLVRVKGIKALGEFNGSAQVDRSKAADLDKSLQALLIGTLRAPFTASSKKYPFDPQERVMEHHQIVDFDLQQVWLIDGRNGEVLAKKHTLKFGP